MHDTAMHLTERVLPHVPIRQWVLSLPRWARWALARDPSRIGRALDAALKTIFTLQRRRARRQGIRGGHCGAISFVPADRSRWSALGPCPTAGWPTSSSARLTEELVCRTQRSDEGRIYDHDLRPTTTTLRPRRVLPADTSKGRRRRNGVYRSFRLQNAARLTAEERARSSWQA
jgi:hypothetical protein